MKFYKYRNLGEKGIKRFSNNEFTSKEVKVSLLNNDNKNYLYLPTYQDRGRDFRLLYSPCKGIETVEQLEDFLYPKENTFVWDNNEWRIKIHTPEQLLLFYEEYASFEKFLDNIEGIRECMENYDIAIAETICNTLQPDASPYKMSLGQGLLMAFQMGQIEMTGGILISKDLTYRSLDCPTEKFNKEYKSKTFDFPYIKEDIDRD